MIQVRKKLESGWLMGEIQIKGQKKQVGYFPASYVKSIGKSSGDDSLQSAPKSPQITKEDKVEKVVTLYPYAASQVNFKDKLAFFFVKTFNLKVNSQKTSSNFLGR